MITAYGLTMTAYMCYHLLSLKRSYLMRTTTRSRDLKLAMEKCEKYHKGSLKLSLVWPAVIIKDIFDVVKS
jgi:hypothetical protein